MSTTPPYEFEEDEAPRPERKKFIPGLEPAPQAAPVTAPAAGLAPAPAAPVPAARAPLAPSAPPADANDPDLKPGSRKDLWSCPHCGTGNRPDRTTCRACGKLPSDAKAKTWWQKPLNLAGIAGVVVFLALIWVITRPNLAFKPTGKARVDRGAAITQPRDLLGKTFTPRGRISACGRIVAARPLPGAEAATTVVLLISHTNTRDVDGADPQFNGNAVDNLPPKSVVLHLIPSEGAAKFNLTKGAWLSVVGDYGQFADGVIMLPATEVGEVVAVEQFDQTDPQ